MGWRELFHGGNPMVFAQPARHGSSCGVLVVFTQRSEPLPCHSTRDTAAEVPVGM
jgi:hypothetical protein